MPALEAAHIKDSAEGGRHAESNGIALRSDLHRLSDRGYLGVDADFRMRVSPRLRAFGNDVELYERESRGELVRLPLNPVHRPDRAALDWHMRERFLDTA